MKVLSSETNVIRRNHYEITWLSINYCDAYSSIRYEMNITKLLCSIIDKGLAFLSDNSSTKVFNHSIITQKKYK